MQLKQRFLWANTLEYICLKVWLLSTCLLSSPFVLSNKARKVFLTNLSFRGDSLALLVERKSTIFYFIFLFFWCKKLIDTLAHTLTYIHASPRQPYFMYSLMFPITLSNTANVFAAWHAYWNGNATISKWKSFIRWLLSGFIHDNLLFSCRIILMRGLKGGVRACVCVYGFFFFCTFMQGDSCPGEKGPRFNCFQLSPLFRRRGLDLVLYHSRAHWCALPAI